jgi:Signal transduction histidine kinase, nitrate/nitrite-specific
VLVALITNGAFEVWFSYQEYKSSLIRIQREQAEAAAAKIGQFIREIEAQVGWTTQLPWSAGHWSSDVSTECGSYVRFRRSPSSPNWMRLATSNCGYRGSPWTCSGSQIDYSKDPKFTEAVAHKVYYGPVYFRRESEPYMTLSLAGTRRDAGVSVAEVNLKLIWDVVSQIKVGEHGHAYVVDSQGRLIAHPDISLVLRNTDLSRLAQVQAAQARARGAPADQVQEAEEVRGRRVLTAYAPVAPLGWLMFVELPIEEAYAPLYATLYRSFLLLLAGLLLALIAGLFLARKMVVPIQALRVGAARIGAGDLGQRISIKTGDELEGLADQFNDMAGKLQDSYADMENKVETRTQELAQSVGELRALGEVSQAVNSTIDLETVLNTIVTKAAQLAGTEAGAIYVYDEAQNEFRLRATYGMSEELITAMQDQHASISEAVSDLTAAREPNQVADLLDQPSAPVNAIMIKAGYRARLLVPLLAPDGPVGALVVRRREPGEFPKKRSTSCRPSRLNRRWRSRTRGCSAKSARRASSWKSRASTSRNSSPT